MLRWTRDVFEGTPTLTRLGYKKMRMTRFAEAPTMEEQNEEEAQEEQVNDLPATQPPMDPLVEEEEEDDIPVVRQVGDADDEEELAKKPDSQSDQENEVPSPKKQPKARQPKGKRDESMTTRDSSAANVERLKMARRNLNADGKDHMEESQAIAATVNHSPKKGTLFEEKPSAKHISTENSDNDEERRSSME